MQTRISPAHFLQLKIPLWGFCCDASSWSITSPAIHDSLPPVRHQIKCRRVLWQQSGGSLMMIGATEHGIPHPGWPRPPPLPNLRDHNPDTEFCQWVSLCLHYLQVQMVSRSKKFQSINISGLSCNSPNKDVWRCEYYPVDTPSQMIIIAFVCFFLRELPWAAFMRL